MPKLAFLLAGALLLLGARQTHPLDPGRWAAGLRPGRAEAAPRWTTTARITFYRDAGYMASGSWTYEGAAACGYAIPLYAWVTIYAPDTTVTVQCLDRGWLGGTQIDVYSPWRPWWMTADWMPIDVW